MTLTSGSPDDVDHSAVGAAITTIGSNLPEMTKDVKMIAALMDDTNNGEKLLDATRQLCTAFSDLLKAAEPESKEVNNVLHHLKRFFIFLLISASSKLIECCNQSWRSQYASPSNYRRGYC